MRNYTFLAGILAAAAVFAAPVDYRDPADARAWAVVLDRTEPLVWRWADGATSATLTVSNIVTRETASTAVARGESPDGSCALPSVAAAEGQSVIDVTLLQTDGSAAVEEKTVRLAVGSPATVFPDASAKPFRNVVDARVYPWSDRWAEESEGASAATLSTAVKDGAAIGSWALPATGGYGVLSPKTSFGGVKGPVTAELSFDGVVRWTAELFMESLGTAILFR